MSDVRDFCANKSGVNFSGPLSGNVFANYADADLQVRQSVLDTTASFAESDCLDYMLYILWQCPSSGGQAPGGTYTSDGLTWTITLRPSSKRNIDASTTTAIEVRQADVGPFLRCTAPGQTSHADIEDYVREFCSTHASNPFVYLTQDTHQHGSVGVYEWGCAFGKTVTFAEQTCIDNMLRILQNCPASGDLTPRGEYVTQSDCLSWVITAADNLLDPGAGDKIESAKLSKRSSVTCDSSTSSETYGILEDHAITFCEAFDGKPVAQTDAAVYLGTKYDYGYAVNHCPSNSANSTKQSVNQAICVDNMLAILDNCHGQDSTKAFGGTYTDEFYCIKYTIKIIPTINSRESNLISRRHPTSYAAHQFDAGDVVGGSLDRRNIPVCHHDKPCQSWNHVLYNVFTFCLEHEYEPIVDNVTYHTDNGTYGVATWGDTSPLLTIDSCYTGFMNIMAACGVPGQDVHGGGYISAQSNLIFEYDLDAQIKARRSDPERCDHGLAAPTTALTNIATTFCDKYASGTVSGEQVLSETFPLVGRMLATFKRSSSCTYTKHYDIPHDFCTSALNELLRQCSSGQSSTGGSVELGNCLSYEITIHDNIIDHPTAPQARQADQIKCGENPCVASSVAVQNATDSFCHTFNGWTLKRNNTISAQVTVSPVAEDGSCLKAGISITNSCFEFFTWYKPCEAGFDDIMDDCDNGNTETSGGTVTAGDNGCVKYKLEVYTAEDGC
ncbi:hypothetical protein LTR78_006039 [Recurvomyces mirabilis]|uniref:Uncharacterized protein n=1 Tax=Recurvomyces mirabilis TaxID=574656 RepID=A0AAE0WM32_9PEZI|nr:hypothetical protein LTR78_006039 [Recurvomyces mirabilis]KAK5155150.1 hypothetical protein LTS14_006105 [Recurvomyces mirabilis]